MIIYIIVFIFIFTPILLYKGKQESKKINVYYILEFIVLFLLMGLRYRVGGDSIRYEEYYLNQPDILTLFKDGSWWRTGFQPGWTLLLATCKTITSSFVIVQLVQSFIVNGAVFTIGYRKCRHKYTFILLYFFMQYFYFNTEILREAIAVAIFLLGYDCLVKGKIIKYLFFCIISFCFHASASILFLLPIIYPYISKARGIKLYALLLLFVIIFRIFATYTAEVLINKVFSYNSMLQDKIEDAVSSGNLNIFGIIKSLINLLPLIFSLYFINKIKENNQDFRERNFIFIMLLLTSIGGIIYVPFVRFENYFTIYFLLFFTDLIYNRLIIRKYNDYVKLALVILIFSKLLWYNTVVSTKMHTSLNFRKYQLWIPYSSYLAPTKDKERERVIHNQSMQ